MSELRCLLVANRGEIARRIFRTATAMGLRTVAVYEPSDAAAPHVRDADTAVPVGSYLDVAVMVDAAVRAGADAIHPGYGFLAENAPFAQAVAGAGLTWVGPPAATIAAMADKLEAKVLAQRHDVPTTPMAETADGADLVGYPLMVKAAAGGGGKGMRIVRSPDELEDAVASARREAGAAFGDDRIFLEPYVERARHVEIQILGDHHGELIHLGERECSIQRRHQKVIEESPSPALTDDAREAMAAAALRLGAALSYRSLGTVEFLYDDTTGDFSFLEVNTRLQVEHPVTELVTGLDLVELQLRVATGEPLPLAQADVRATGHAIEARLYAEDVAAGYLPATGTLAVWAPDDSTGVRFDSGVEQGSVVGVRYDPMLAKVVAHGATRAVAAGRLARALERTAVAGTTTNRDFLVGVLLSREFLAGDTTTDFLERVAVPPTAALTEDERRRVAVAAALWLAGQRRTHAPVLPAVPSGWRNARLPDQSTTLVDAAGPLTVSYRTCRDGTYEVDGAPARVLRWCPDEIDVEHEGFRTRCAVVADGGRLHLHHAHGDTTFAVLPRFPEPVTETPTGGLVAPMPGRILDVRAAPGDDVAGGQVLVVLEAMKMEHHLSATTAGVVDEVRVAVGDQVETGALLLVVE